MQSNADKFWKTNLIAKLDTLTIVLRTKAAPLTQKQGHDTKASSVFNQSTHTVMKLTCNLQGTNRTDVPAAIRTRP